MSSASPIAAPPIVIDDNTGTLSPGDIALFEANHRIANNLTLIAGLVRMHARRLSEGAANVASKDVKFVLDDVASRIQTVARLHKLLAYAGGDEAVEMREYLQQLCASIKASMSSDEGIRIIIHVADGCWMSADQALSLGLIINELATNSIKYAHPTGLPVRISVGGHQSSNGSLVFEFADDGVGLPEGFDVSADGGMGFLVIRNRVEQLHAEMHIEHDCLGLRVRLTVPLERAAIHTS